MSGIFGIFNRSGDQVDPAGLSAMAESLRYRGNDDSGVWGNAEIGIGHQMFHTTPEALHESLPFFDSQSKITITSDARLDNRDELIEQLGINRPGVITDSYLILQAYIKWGTECAKFLLGDFVFALWDEKQKRLVCARDHMGVKPFAYHLSSRRFVFGSEAKSVIASAQVPKELNEGRVADYLLNLEGVDYTSTFYEQVFRLPPAHVLVVTKSSSSITCYWKPDPGKRITFETDQEYVDAFNDIYTDAIDKRLRGNEDVGSMLSGGIDSASIVAIAKELYKSKAGKTLPVFSATSSDSEYSDLETSYIKIIREMQGIDAHVIDSTQLNQWNDDINRVVSELPEPFHLMVMIAAVYLLARKSGCRVVLDGVEGDMICSLPASYAASLIKQGRWVSAVKEMRGQMKNGFCDEQKLTQLLVRNFRSALAPAPVKRFLKKIRSPFNLDEFINDNDSPISREFAQRVQIKRRFDRFNKHAGGTLSSRISSQHLNSIQHPNLTVALERYDRVAASCGIEPRHPLLDKRVVEFMLAIPWDQKVRNGQSKFLLRNAASTVSDAVRWRLTREHVGWGFEKAWMQNNDKNVILDSGSEMLDYYQYLDEGVIGSMKARPAIDKMDDSALWRLRTVYLLLHMNI